METVDSDKLAVFMVLVASICDFISQNVVDDAFTYKAGSQSPTCI